MHTGFTRAASSCVLAMSLISAPLMVPGQQKREEPTDAPVPAAIITAKKVFVANGGDDPHFEELGSDRSYNRFYAAMKAWGRYELVNAPAEADLMLEICLASQASKYGRDFEIIPVLKLTIRDLKTQAVLWVLNEDLESQGIIVGAHQKGKLDRAINRIIAKLKVMQRQPPAATP